MSGLSKRREADLIRLRAMAGASAGQLSLTHADPDGRRLQFTLRLPTAGTAAYPGTVQPESRFEVSLPARYPFEAPTARMNGTPILHPNVFESGVICVGSRWNPSEGLDIYVRRLAQLLCFDPMLVNLGSIANAAGANWYSKTLRAHPEAFPSARIDWAEAPEKVVRSCPSCQTKMRLPAGQQGAVVCPRCQHEFTAST
ncbi:MAG: ubiquitin-conjugating enzyme E2 [Burkholderiaceae bacterium]